MYSIVNEYEFIDVMTHIDGGFSYEGAKALFAYLSDLEEDTIDDLPMGIEFDPIAFRCEYSEYDNCVEAFKDLYGDNEFNACFEELLEPDEDGDIDHEQLEQACREYIENAGRNVITYNDWVQDTRVIGPVLISE